ncbi:hypothetical protein NM688_g6690 [Phlebia brevispora]|uniref:Uncharacterized protein n=1 Tax=Phlebia brevispora TaxID=194682 RepID=A0ACC1SDL2_9APHY|nr:hypothetical protein NM688_g6690 [Phlebia brevispora]
MVAKAALETRSRSRVPSPATSVQGRTDSEGEDVAAAEAGIGNLSYFEPGPSSNLDLRRLIIERQAAPDILLSGLVTNEDVSKLFQIYYKWINPVIPILDENIHTPASVLGRCPFLFTVVLAVASRYYEEKPYIHTLAIHIAKTAAANAFLDGWKTVEMCQAYTLMASYMPPARRWDEDRTWFYSGIAFRLAIDLDLGRPPVVKPTDERGEREVLNRLRTYIICYIVDRSFGINLGKPFMVPEVELIRNVNTMFLSSKYQHKGDAYMASLVELYRIMTRFADIANPATEARADSLNEADLIATHKVFAEELAAWETAAATHCAADEASKDTDDRLRMGLLHSVYQYCRLVTFSAGLHQVMKVNKLKEDKIFFAGCLHAGSAVINCVIERILPTGFIRYSPDHVFALSTFATAVLMKCLRPEFAHKLGPVQEDRIIDLVKRLLKCVDMDQNDTDDQSTPRRCYAKFLQQLLTSRMMERESERAASDSIQFPEAPVQVAITPCPPAVQDTKLEEMIPHTHDMPFLTSWEPPTLPDPSNTNPLLAFNETEYMQNFMASFPDQPWFMQ